MNRLLLIPCVVSCLGFVFLANLDRWGDARANPNPTTNTTAVEGSEVFLTAEQIQEGLITQWSRYNEEKYAFSRVFRPRDQYRTPGVWVQETLPSPEGSFVGVFTLEVKERFPVSAIGNDTENSRGVSKQEFPIVADCRTGEAMVFASGKWNEFNVWAVNGE